MEMSPLDREYTDKKTNMRAFAKFGGSELFQITHNVAPELYAIAGQFPKVLRKALFMLGGHIRGGMRSAVDDGGTGAHKWLHLSDMHRYRRMDRLKAGEFPRKSYRGQKKKGSAGKWTAPGLIARSKNTPDPSGVFGKVGQTIAFKVSKDGKAVDIGALSPSAASFLAAVQGGKRGSQGTFQFSGRQIVTPAMRRALWAAGFPLAADTTVIGQEPRPLVAPVFQHMSPQFEPYLAARLAQLFVKYGIEVV